MIAGSALAAVPAFATDSGAPASGVVQGFDVSNYQAAAPDFTLAVKNGAKFVLVKAGDAESLTKPGYSASAYFAAQWAAAGTADLIRGAYVVAGPGNGKKAADPKAEADAFAKQVAALLDQPRTLPPIVDLERGATTTCWMATDAVWARNLAANQRTMVAWLRAFSAEVRAKVGRLPLIYTNTDWWSMCTGGSSSFRANGLFLAAYGVAKPAVPKGWATYAFWQWRATASGAKGFPGDPDVFHGSGSALNQLAKPFLKAGPVPVVHGIRRVGQTLSAAVGSWPSGTTLTYQWYASGKAIPHATGAKLKLAGALRGAKIAVRVTGTKPGFVHADRWSTTTAKIA